MRGISFPFSIVVFILERFRGSVKGKDQFDLFAEALTSVLPRVTDSPEEEFKSFLGRDGSNSRAESLESDKSETGQKTPKASIQEKKKLTASIGAMAGIMRMSSFVGRGDRKESLSDFLADVEMAAKCWDTAYGGDTDKPDGSKIAIFRQNLDKDGDAWYWWSCVLSDEEKKTFAGIKTAFLARYGAEKNKAISKFNLQNELMCLQQKKGQTIIDYVREAENLSERVPKDMDDMLAMAFIRGLGDQESRRRISYDLRDTPEFSFAKALGMVKAWYREIGVPDPFNRFGVGFNTQRQEQTLPIYAAPAPGVIAARSETTAVNGTINENPSSAQATNPMQEAFNQMMLNFMNGMKTDFRQTPHRTPGVTNAATGGGQGSNGGQRGAASGAGSTGVICYNCQKAGHYASQCRSPSVKNADHKGARESMRTEGVGGQKTVVVREGANSQGPASIVPRVSVANEVRRLTEITEEEQQLSPVSCIKVVSVAADKNIVGAACSTLMRMPAVAAIFEKAMIDKRVRIDDDDYEQPVRGTKQPRIEHPTTRSGTATGSSQCQQLQVLTDTTPEPDSSDDEEAIVLQPGARIPRVVETPPQTQGQPQTKVPVSTPLVQPPMVTRKGITVKTGFKPVPPINWMQGQKQYSLQDALNDVTPKISFPQLLDVSPRLRRELAELLRSSVPRVRKKGKGKTTQASTDMVGVVKHTPLIMTEAHDDGEVNCLYIDAWIGDHLVSDVLVDGGAMLDLISQKVVKKLKLEKHLVKGLGMRLADDSLVRLDHYVWADVIVAGVVARIKAYVVPVFVTYKVLLSRRWLKRVHCIEYHETNILHIEGMDRIRREVKGKPASKEEVEIVRIEPDHSVQEVESDEAEEAIEILLHKLDHWEDGVEGE